MELNASFRVSKAGMSVGKTAEFRYATYLIFRHGERVFLTLLSSTKANRIPNCAWRRGVVARTPFCNVCDIVCTAFSAIFPGIRFTRSRVTKFLCYNEKLKQTSTKILLTTCFKMHSLFYRKSNEIQFKLPKYTLRGFSGHLRGVEMASGDNKKESVQWANRAAKKRQKSTNPIQRLLVKFRIAIIPLKAPPKQRRSQRTNCPLDQELAFHTRKVTARRNIITADKRFK